MKDLPLGDPSSFPYRLRQLIGFGKADPKVDTPAPNPLVKFFLQVVSIVPTLVAMVFPIWWMKFFNESDYGVLELVRDSMSWSLVFVGLFMVYTISFAASEFVRHWRSGLRDLGLLKPPPKPRVAPFQ